MPARLLAALALTLALAGCGGGDSPSVPSSDVAAPAEPADDGCGLAHPDKKVAGPKGLVVPDGTEVGLVADAPPNQRATGFVPLTPDEFVEYMENREELGMLFKESEGFEAEVMVSDGKVRSFWKVEQACPEGSSFTVLTGKEIAPGAAKDAIKTQHKKPN